MKGPSFSLTKGKENPEIVWDALPLLPKPSLAALKVSVGCVDPGKRVTRTQIS